MDISPSQHYVFNLSGYTLIMYAAAVAVYYIVLMGNLRLIGDESQADKAKSGRHDATLFLVGLGTNILGAAAVALLGKLFSIPSRQSMVYAPLLLLLERHIRLSVESPNNRRHHAVAATGAAAGMLAGAAAFLGSDAAQETFARVEIPGDVVTIPVAEALQNPSGWSVSIQLVVFYCISLAIFETAHHLLKRMSNSKAAELRDGRRRETLIAFASALALNFLAAGMFVLLGKWAAVQIRQAMILLPLFVITESYVKLMRADLVNRRAYLLGLAGSGLGLAGAWLLFLRSAPIH
ncbi:MAG: hypothetical protein Q8T11_12785 [Elusimicrobiota bacterium]|nr:hypothetical protein [Elusimicrobiota bacterium]